MNFKVALINYSTANFAIKSLVMLGVSLCWLCFQVLLQNEEIFKGFHFLHNSSL